MLLTPSYISIELRKTVMCDTSIPIAKLCVGRKCKREIVEPEAGMVGSESICSGNVLVQSIHPGLTTRISIQT